MTFNVKDFIEAGSLISTGSNQLLIGLGERRWSKNPIKDTPSFYFPDFFLENKAPWFTHKYWEIISLDSLSSILSSHNGDLLDPLQWTNAYATFFENTFYQLLEQIKKKMIDKAVPFVFERCSSMMSEKQMYRSLCSLLTYAKNQFVNIYGFWTKDEGILGATPEVLFSWDNQNGSLLKTMACAGTCPHGEAKKGLLEDSKQIREHQYVIEGIRESLDKLGDVQEGELNILELPTLSHLITSLTVNLKKDINFDDIVKTIHPTPALGVYPRKNGDLWLRSYQHKIDRKRFGAPAGFLYNEIAKCYVAIRNVQWNTSGMFIGAGCGIVEESVLEKEWSELCLKIHAIKTILAL
jgi:menaquinone-specific isochorismate synthase